MRKNAKYRAIPCYYDEETEELTGRNWLFDKLVALNVWFDFEILQIDELPLWIEIDESETDIK